MRKYVPSKHTENPWRRMPRHIWYFSRPTSGKFETELTERAPRNGENGLKIIRGEYVFLVFTKIALNKPLLPYGFSAVTLGRLEDISKRV